MLPQGEGGAELEEIESGTIEIESERGVADHLNLADEDASIGVEGPKSCKGWNIKKGKFELPQAEVLMDLEFAMGVRPRRFSHRRTNWMQDEWVYSHDGPIGRAS
eukprot:903086-Prorocentrum_minimum.AAC.4